MMNSHLSNDPHPDRAALQMLNRECFCFSLDREALADALNSEFGNKDLSELVQQRCPFVFAAQPVFVPPEQLQRMAQVVQAVGTVVALPGYREQMLADAPEIARLQEAAHSVFFGYDFHLAADRLGLIEINTNAGGAMLNAVLAKAQRACCAAMQALVPTHASVVAFEQRIIEMFRREWRLSGRTRPLSTIAIVDEAPQQQYLYPEFLLFQQLFQRHGLRTVIASPTDFAWRSGHLWHGDDAIDLIYNRLTDFYLEQPSSAVLREAYLQRAIVLTPHPQAHALYADKRRLAVLSDETRLVELGAPDSVRQILLAHVPRTEVVDIAHAERLWETRRRLFFKPVAGFGSRAAYRGDKLTRGVWPEILARDYVAQEIVSPGERVIEADATRRTLKFDLRAYAYDGGIQWVAARLYQGQTTNFRTPGGGFAPVYSTVDPASLNLDALPGSR